jgi:hypothetical protein
MRVPPALVPQFGNLPPVRVGETYMRKPASCYACASPIESGPVICHGEAHCSFECAALTCCREPSNWPVSRFIDPEPGSEP